MSPCLRLLHQDVLEHLHHLGRRPFSPLIFLLPLLSSEPSNILGRLFCWVRWITRFFLGLDAVGLDGVDNA